MSRRLLIRAAAGTLTGLKMLPLAKTQHQQGRPVQGILLPGFGPGKRLPSAPRYLEIPGAHNVVDKRSPGWAILEQAILEFARSIRVDERVRV